MEKRYIDEMSGRGPYRVNSEVEKPNVFLLSADMIPLEFYQHYDGFPDMNTPNLDRMRSDSVFFSNCFSTSPLCSPSRASYLTGRYSYITTNSERSHDGHEVHLRDSDIIFPEYLKSAGYTVRHVGKSHVGTHKFIDTFGENDSPWNRWSPPWYDDDEYIAYLDGMNLERFSFEKEIVGVDPSGEGPGNHHGGWIAKQNGKEFPVDATYPFFLVHKIIAKLKAVSPTQPFYFQLDFFGPHQPFAIPHGFDDRRKELEKAVIAPDSFIKIKENGFQSRKPEPRIYSMYRKSFGLIGTDTVKQYIIANILNFELIDMAIGRLFEYLEQQKLYRNSWMLFIGDHGEMNCESGLIDKGAYLNPRVIRVPLIIKPSENCETEDSFTGVNSVVDYTPVSLLDIAPSILGLAGIQHEERQDGSDIIHTVMKGKKRPDTPILCEIWSHLMPNPAIGMIFRSSDEKLYMFTYNTTDPVDELYQIDRTRYPVNIIHEVHAQTVLREAILHMDEVLAADVRWRGYSSFLRLEYAEILDNAKGDRQRFLR